jgi:signal transduction histidine kinase
MAVTKNSTPAQIRFSTQILKRLGEELNPSVDQSILELVKNAYDADATTCTVELKDITEEGGTIIIEDSGDGMDEKTIIDGWLVLGESSKNVFQLTPLGRIPAGSKGLGRLAALRMGTKAILKSVRKDNLKLRHEVAIDWNEFDAAKHVNDVFIPVYNYDSPSALKKGTSITIKDIRFKLGEREVKRIARGLILLSDPFEDDPNAFKPKLKSEEFRQMEELVSHRYFDDAEYHLRATLDENGYGKASILDYLGNILFEADHDTLTKRKGAQPYAAPALTFDLWAFLLNETSFATRKTTVGEVRVWLTEFGGVHLYENGLRVNPYGNQGNDWLDINVSRARSPEERPSTNTSIGIVRIPDSKGMLWQKTDRSGFIENDSFHDIRSFCRDALDWMARERMQVAEKKRRAERQRTAEESDDATAALNNVVKRLPRAKRAAVEKAVIKYQKSHQDEVKALRSEIQLYRTLSTAGITAATFSHESRGNPIKVIKTNLKTIKRRIQQYFTKKYEEFFAASIDNIQNSVDSLAVLSTATLKLLEHEKRRPVKVNIHEVLDNILDIFKPFFDGRDITVEKNFAPGNPYLRSSVASIESIITNLLNNSISVLENVMRARHVYISTDIHETVLILKVADNGPGIVGINLKDIWLPGQTTNPNGTGLGLTIVRDAVFDLAGKVSAVANGEHGGAELIIELPIIGK